MSIAREIKDSFKFGSNLTKLIYINLGVFVFLRFFLLFEGVRFEDSLTNIIAVSSSLQLLAHQPWSLVTYMFVHVDFIHILFNLLCLYWFGQIFLHYLSQKQLVGVYILGGLFGSFLFVASFNLIPFFIKNFYGAIAIGASASVLAIIIAISTLKPNLEINLLFIGPVKLKYLAIFTVFLDITSIFGSNAGGHIAHLGGALFGYLYIVISKQGIDLAKPITWILDVLSFKPRNKSKLKVDYSSTDIDYDYNKRKAEQSVNLDKILDKIAKSGYDSLSKEEKETLFKFKDKSVN